MHLRARIKRLFRSDAHAIIKGLEDPAALLENSIMHMEDIIAKQSASYKTLMKEQESLTDLVNKQTNRLDHIKEELELCLADDKEELASDTVQRLMIAENEISKTNEMLSLNKREAETLESSLKQHQLELEDVTLKAELQELKSKSSTKIDSHGVSKEEIAIRLLKEKKAREGLR